MKTTCPQCGYEGNIKDELIPDRGRTVGCPKCKTKFFAKKRPTGDAAPHNRPAGPEMDIYGGEFILAKRGLRNNRAVGSGSGLRIVILFLSLVMVFIFGLLVGRHTHDYTFTNPLEKKSGPPVTLKTPESSLPPQDESTEPPVAGPLAPTTPGGDIASPPPSEPLILEESFTSDVYLDITEIDAKVNEETEATGVKRELMLKEYGGDLVGKNLVGYFIVRDVGKLNASFSKMLPLSLYGYYIEAEGDSSDPIKNVVYIGLKQADELASTLDKGTKVFIKGFVYGCALAADHFELGLVNGEVEPR